MADVARKLKPDTEYLLDGFEVEWDVGVRMARNWTSLTDDEQAVFVETWAIPRGYIHELRLRSERGELTASQRRRFAILQRRVDEQRATIEAVLEDIVI